MKLVLTALSTFAIMLANASPAAASPANARSAAAASAKTENKPLTEKQLVAKVQREYKKYGKNVSGLKPGCYSFEADQAQQSVTQREVHNKKCGGDQATSPAIAHYDVKDGKVLIEDPVSGNAIAFDKNFKSDGP